MPLLYIITNYIIKKLKRKRYIGSSSCVTLLLSMRWMYKVFVQKLTDVSKNLNAKDIHPLPSLHLLKPFPKYFLGTPLRVLVLVTEETFRRF